MRTAAFPESCFAVQQAGLEGGYYTIDPEQDGANEFTVYCNTSVSPAVAILRHNQEARTLVTGYEDAGEYVAQVI